MAGDDVQGLIDENRRLGTENAALRAENARLREAVNKANGILAESIAKGWHNRADDCGQLVNVLVRLLASAALGGENG